MDRICAGNRLVLSRRTSALGRCRLTNTADREVGIITSQPFVNGPQNGWVGAITTNAGGLAKAEVQALCLK